MNARVFYESIGSPFSFCLRALIPCALVPFPIRARVFRERDKRDNNYIREKLLGRERCAKVLRGEPTAMSSARFSVRRLGLGDRFLITCIMRLEPAETELNRLVLRDRTLRE